MSILNIIKLRLKFILASICLFTGAALLLTISMKDWPYASFLFLALAGIILILIILLIAEYKEYSDAKLILENEILHIQIVGIEERDAKVVPKVTKLNPEFVTISCFGILSDSKMVKFNKDKIFLDSIEITQHKISFTYSIGGANKKVIILHDKLADEQIQNIVQKFKYETGVLAKILDM